MKKNVKVIFILVILMFLSVACKKKENSDNVNINEESYETNNNEENSNNEEDSSTEEDTISEKEYTSEDLIGLLEAGYVDLAEGNSIRLTPGSINSLNILDKSYNEEEQCISITADVSLSKLIYTISGKMGITLRNYEGEWDVYDAKFIEPIEIVNDKGSFEDNVDILLREAIIFGSVNNDKFKSVNPLGAKLVSINKNPDKEDGYKVRIATNLENVDSYAPKNYRYVLFDLDKLRDFDIWEIHAQQVRYKLSTKYINTKWIGWYKVGNYSTKATLTLSNFDTRRNVARGLVEFDSPNGTIGSYYVDFGISDQDLRFTIKGTDWGQMPEGYSMVDFSGYLDPINNKMTRFEGVDFEFDREVQ